MLQIVPPIFRLGMLPICEVIVEFMGPPEKEDVKNLILLLNGLMAS